jgi:spore coat protein CotH
MGLVQSVGSKLDDKMKSGEIKESELISEATEIMNKMKNMHGMSDIQAMLSKMGMAGMGGLGNLGGKVNTSAMEAQLERKLKLAKQKERMKAKLDATKLAKENELLAAAAAQSSNTPLKPELSTEDIIKIFSNENNNQNKNNQDNNNLKNNNNKKKNKKTKNK